MVEIDDIRHRTRFTNSRRKLSSIKNIARHYSATNTGNFDAFWNHWNGKLGWGTGGYHEIILRDGTVQLCYDPEQITNGVGGQNSYIYNICLVGLKDFTEAQEKAWDERARYWMKRLGLPVSAVKGHKEFPGQSTACPGVDMNVVRKKLSAPQVKPVEKPKEEEVRYLKLSDWQKDEVSRVYATARKKGIFSSDEHEKKVKEGKLTVDQAILLATLIAGANMNDGERIK